MRLDPDKPDPRVVAELVGRYEESARRLRDRILNPPGSSAGSREWNQSRAAQILAQVDAEIARLKRDAASWTSAALRRAVDQGIVVANSQARQAGIRPTGTPLRGSFAVLDRRTVEVFARDTVSDLVKAADSMRRQARTVLRRIAADRLTTTEVNRVLTDGVIEGRPRAAIRELREELLKVYGTTVTITDRNGQPRQFKAGYYARVVAVTKTREAAVMARHERLADLGLDLVRIIGRRSSNFCTEFLGQIYSISGKHPKYPPLSDLPGGGPPFHPNCSKGSSPFVEALSEDIE